MAQALWKQSAAEVLSVLTRLLLHRFETQYIKWKERNEGLCLFWMSLSCLMGIQRGFGRLLDIYEKQEVAVTVRDSATVTARCLHFS